MIPRTAADFDELRGRNRLPGWLDDTEWQWLVTRDERAQLARALIDSVPPCPPWCSVGAQHDYEDVTADDPIVLTRFHYSGREGDIACFQQAESVEGGRVTLGPIRPEYDSV